MTTLLLLRKLADAYFVRRSAVEILPLLSENLHCYGLANGVEITSLNDARTILASADYTQFMGYTYAPEGCEEISDDCATFSFALTSYGVTMHYLLTGTGRIENGERRLFMLHFSLKDKRQTLDMYAKAATVKREETMRSVLRDAMPGGIMGGYCEEGFPFYCINDNMLSYLGYDTEDEFITATNGLVANCIYEADRRYVADEVENQLAQYGSYTVEYRMLTKAGGFIWVHDVGRTTKAEDGRDAIISAVYDISREKEHADFVARLADTVDASMGIYYVEENGKKLIPAYLSDRLGSHMGLTKDEYLTLYRADAMHSVYMPDRHKLRESVRAMLKDGEPRSSSFRIKSADGGFVWTNAAYSKYGEQNGKPVIRAVFTPATTQFELQMQALSQTSTGICVLNAANLEILYVNDAAFALLDKEQEDYTGRKCYELFETKKESKCEYCPIPCDFADGQTVERTFEINNGKILHVHIEKREWNGMQALVMYSRDITEQQRTQDKLQEEKRLLEARIELEEKQQNDGSTSLLAHFITNVTQNRPLEHRYRFDERMDLLEWKSLESQLEHTKQYVVYPEKREKFMRMHETAHLLEMYDSGETHESLDYRRRFPNGRVLWVRTVIHLVKDPETGDLLNYEYLYDIHSQKVREELMAAVMSFGFERCASLMLDAGQFNVLLPTENGHTQLKVEDYTEALPRYAADIIPEDREEYLKNATLESIAERLKAETHYEINYREKVNGETRYKKVQYFRHPEDAAICLMLRTDVTETVTQQLSRRQELQNALDAKEAALRERENIYTALFSIVPMVISANITQNYYTMLNYDSYTTRKAARSGSYDELIRVGTSTVPDEDKAAFEGTFCAANIVKKYKAGEKYVVLEHRQYGDDGILRWIETRCIFVTNPGDDSLYTITLAQDVTERREQQTKLEKALDAANAATVAKSEFLSRMSHEIRTPMNAIIGMTAIAKESMADYTQVSECLEKIDMSSHFLLTLINDILEMSRIESGRMEIKHKEFDFDSLIDSIRTVIEPLALRSGIRYEFINSAKTDAAYIGDVMRIQQVLVNILTNAVKFTPKGGRVRFTANIEGEDEHTAHFKFTVADTGIGMSEEFMQRMFAPFTQEDSGTTSRFGGSGLGLAISKSLVQAMDGEITAESFLGIGSTFTVTLPLTRLNYMAEHEAEAARKAPVALDIIKGCNVLMAEDHPLNVMVARKLLERKGVRVTVAENGQIAVDMFKKSTPGHYKAILMDIRMPVMDGIEAAKTIRELNRPDALTVPIIAMTANALEEDRQNTRKAGMNAHLAKPFEPVQLYKTLAEQIGKAGI